MLAAPAHNSRLPSVILLTTGVEHHVGPHRLYVPLSRDWAARGHLVLRYDVGGIGDSLPPPGGQENTSYPSHLLDDAAEAIAFTRRTAPDRPVIVAGLCSGGWAAFLAAREGLEVDAIVAVNPPLYLRDADAGAAWRAEIEELDRYQQLSRDPAKWIRALRQPPSIGNVARMATLALRRSTAAWVGRTAGEGLAGDLARIADRRVDALLVFSARDKGLEYFQEFGATASQPAQVQHHIRHVVVDGAGHSFRPRHAQETLRKLLIDFVGAKSVGTT
jgi:pimeloyl-ACP methyl ester carboxylesterase